METTRTVRRTALALYIVLTLIVFIAAGGYLLLRTYYPLEYEEEILQYSQEFGVDPYFVYAIAATESKFQTKAQSEAGALGVMQIMPDTAAWIAPKIGLEYTEDLLFDPEANIRMGTWYLSYLSELYQGDTGLMAAAYNAGQGTVSGWIEQGIFTGEEDEVQKIPYEETKNYVQKVKRANEIYKLFYKIG